MGVVFPPVIGMCCKVTRVSLFCQLPLLKFRICTVPPPSRVMRFPPSMTVSLSVWRFSVEVTRMVAGALPHLNVMMPALATADCSALNVQLAAVPVPTTVVGLEVLAACPSAGTPVLHEPFGLPACCPPSEVAPDELVPLLLPLPPPLLEPEPEPEPEAEPELEPLPELEVDPVLEVDPELEPEPELALTPVIPELELAPPPEEPLETPLPPLVPGVLELLPQPVIDIPAQSATNKDWRSNALLVGPVMMRSTIALGRATNHRARSIWAPKGGQVTHRDVLGHPRSRRSGGTPPEWPEPLTAQVARKEFARMRPLRDRACVATSPRPAHPRP